MVPVSGGLVARFKSQALRTPGPGEDDSAGSGRRVAPGNSPGWPGVLHGGRGASAVAASHFGGRWSLRSFSTIASRSQRERFVDSPAI